MKTKAKPQPLKLATTSIDPLTANWLQLYAMITSTAEPTIQTQHLDCPFPMTVEVTTYYGVRHGHVESFRFYRRLK